MNENLFDPFLSQKKALNGVNIQIGQAMFGFIGRNGAGKTTLMRIVTAIMEATDGEKSCGV